MACIETEKYTQFIQRKKNKSTETALEKDLMTDLLDKDFKNNCLKLRKEQGNMYRKTRK